MVPRDRFCSACDYQKVSGDTKYDHVSQPVYDTEILVIKDIIARQQRGLDKYGTTVAANLIPLREWLQHQYEELLDAAIYCKRAMQEMDN
jgi:hypothetical protein